jgi:hypothetical protein
VTCVCNFCDDQKQVSAVSDQIGMQDIGVNPGELDDDEGGGLVRRLMRVTPPSLHTLSCN